MSRLPRAACALAAAALAGSAAASPFAAGGNSGFVARAFALPELGAARLVRRGETTLSVDVANEYVHEGACAAECIVLDGETARLRLSHRRALGGGFELALDVPFLDQDGGFLDGWIQDWHRWFGLSNGGREFVTDGLHRFKYARDGITYFDETAGARGLGDVDVTLGRALGSAGVLRALARLPTADEPLLGGGAGGALWLDLALPVPAGWEGYLSAGISQTEAGNLWGGLQRRRLAFGGIGLAAPLFGSAQLVAQAQAYDSAFDDSAVSPLFRPGMPLTIGLRVGLGGGAALDLGFQEDLSVNASPDLAVRIAVTVR